jgi:hypothetical protein
LPAPFGQRQDVDPSIALRFEAALLDESLLAQGPKILTLPDRISSVGEPFQVGFVHDSERSDGLQCIDLRLTQSVYFVANANRIARVLLRRLASSRDAVAIKRSILHAC